jgi:hypothetical protein
MQNIIVTTYKFSELQEEAKQHAIDAYREMLAQHGEIPWADDVVNSAKGAFDAMDGVTLVDYSIGIGSSSYLVVRFDNDDIANLIGRRAFAWYENHFIGKYRITWSGISRRNTAKFGTSYRPGMVKPCPFTGYYFDDVIVAHVFNALKEGYTIKYALKWIAQLAESELEREWEYYLSDECIIEEITANDYDFLGDGERWHMNMYNGKKVPA